MRHDETRPPRRLRWWFALVTAAIVLCTVMVAVVVIATTTARSSTDVADETVRRIGERTADLMVGHLDDAIESTEQLDVLLSESVLAERGPDLDRLLAAQVRTISQLSGAFVGFPDGSFRFVSRREEGLVLRRIDTAPTFTATDAVLGADLRPLDAEPVDTDYDPRTRPWYENAQETDSATWTSPYVFFSSGQPGVTLSQPVRDLRGGLVAVIGVDVSLAELSRFLDDLPIGEGAEAFITAGDVIVAGPSSYDLTSLADDGSVELGTIDQLGIGSDDFRRLALERIPVETADGGRLHLIELEGPDEPRWAVLVRTDRPELSELVDRLARWSIVIVMLTGLLLLASIPLLTRSFRRAIDELNHRASVDTLTSVLNRGTFLDAATAALDEAVVGDEDLALAILDVDDFKSINDELGHQHGDAVLADIGRAIGRSVRPIDVVGRLGGDEFAIVVVDLDRPRVDAILERLQTALGDGADPTDTHALHSSVTIGVAALDGRRVELRELFAEADAALIEAKRVRKGSIAWRDRPASSPSTSNVPNAAR